jgi:Lon protease-like protein
MVASPFKKAQDLPLVIPLFPLDGALLLPHAQLPLQVFEPRYIAMVDEAMAGERIIGMVQTRPGGDPERPSLQPIGCAGKITTFAETSDGRYLITLTGLSRFALREEIAVPTPYRQGGSTSSSSRTTCTRRATRKRDSTGCACWARCAIIWSGARSTSTGRRPRPPRPRP